MKILKELFKLVTTTNKEDKNSIEKYLYPLKVLKFTENDNVIIASIAVPEGICYIVNSIPITSFSNNLLLDRSAYPKAFIEQYNTIEKDVTLGEFDVNKHSFKILVRYESTLNVCEVLNPGEKTNYAYFIYKEYELNAGEATKAVPELSETKVVSPKMSLESISAGQYNGNISEVAISNVVYHSIMGNMGSLRLDNVIVLKSISVGMGEISGTIYCLPTTSLINGMGKMSCNIIRLPKEKLILKAQELNLL